MPSPSTSQYRFYPCALKALHQLRSHPPSSAHAEERMQLQWKRRWCNRNDYQTCTLRHCGKWRHPPGCLASVTLARLENGGALPVVKGRARCGSVKSNVNMSARLCRARPNGRSVRPRGIANVESDVQSGARHVCMVVVCCACKQLVAAQSSMCRSVARERRLVPLRIWTRRDSHPAARAAVRHVEWRDVLICNMLARTHRARMRDTEQSVGVRGKRRRWEALR